MVRQSGSVQSHDSMVTLIGLPVTGSGIVSDRFTRVSGWRQQMQVWPFDSESLIRCRLVYLDRSVLLVRRPQLNRVEIVDQRLDHRLDALGITGFA
jgi:hypothetical protein